MGSDYGLELDDTEQDPDMVERGRRAAESSPNVVLREGLAQDSGLPPASFDTAIVRLVLIHNGGREQRIVDHAASLVRPGGRVLLYDLETTMFRVVPPTAPVSELGERFLAYQRARGNDPAVGLRLPEFLGRAGLRVEAFRGQCRTGTREPGQRGPIWAARRAMVDAGVATPADLDRWAAEFESLDAAANQPWIVGSVFVAVGRRPE